jgi:hypothetical protein
VVKSALVSDGTGFMGPAIVARLLDRGFGAAIRTVWPWQWSVTRRVKDRRCAILIPDEALLWPLLVRPARAYEFLFTGDTVTATDALSLGLVNHVYPSHEVFDRAVGFAERLARGSLAIIQAIKLLTHQTATALSERFIRAGMAMESISQTCAAHHPTARRAPSTRSRIWAAEYHHDTVRAFLAGDPVVF